MAWRLNNRTWNSATLGAGARKIKARLFVMFIASLFLVGCATLRRENSLPESVATCRRLSRDGVAAMERGDETAARELLLRAVQQSPTDVDARQRLAEVLWRMGAEEEALRHVDAAVRLAPNDASTLVWAGEMHLARGELDAAQESADAAIALDRTLAQAWSLRGRTKRQQNEPEWALADLQQSLRYNPQTPEVLLEAAELQYLLGRPERCLTTLHRLLDIYSPGDEPRRALWLEGLAFRATNRPTDAVASLYAASQQGESQPDLLYQLAVSQRAIGDLASARATAQQALAANSAHEPSRLLIAQLSSASDAQPDGLMRR